MGIGPASILCIDDDPFTRASLRAMLENAAYRVFDAATTSEGHQLARRHQTDLILLDVMLPEMKDGFALCRALKSDDLTRSIPVVFMSSNADPRWIADGLRCGGADYVSKPLYPAELLMRVDLQIRIRSQEQQLTSYATALEQMVEERTRSLLHADRLASIGTLAAGTAHEINNPTSVIRGNVDTLELYWTKIEPAVRAQLRVQQDPLLESLLAETPATLDAMRRATDRIAIIVRGLLQFGGRRKTSKSAVDVPAVINEALGLVHNRLKYKVEVHWQPGIVPLAWGNECELSQVVVNLLTNAADAIGSRGGHIWISLSENDGMVGVVIEDDGPGLPSGCEKKVLEPFFTTKEVGKGTGLGLPICQAIAQDHSGEFDIGNRSGGGCRARFSIPTASLVMQPHGAQQYATASGSDSALAVPRRMPA
jgi:signal transduction histidine kinase